jgi:molybdenum cofactor synthesis domain-containing protein
VPDEQPEIEAALRTHAAQAQLVVTTGGTGVAARDVTPEATRAVCTRILDGFAERMRAAGARQTPLAALSRAVSGVCGRALVVNLPGKPEGAVTSLEAVLDLIPHALALLSGADPHSDAAPADTSGAPRA